MLLRAGRVARASIHRQNTAHRLRQKKKYFIFFVQYENAHCRRIDNLIQNVSNYRN